ncbi:hypothetical protein [Mycobacteroides abscessus]|uniref:hypothetical protein n=1 Tax=Mycobacteroides abscessus TaxID=36809 RepID=UPI0009A7F351|nr:hypothetical protein [Mycobacteroides abscessus]SLH38336.1 Uncharacterised protein [Mycobacteroides abscessus subsp. massiliense]
MTTKRRTWGLRSSPLKLLRRQPRKPAAAQILSHLEELTTTLPATVEDAIGADSSALPDAQALNDLLLERGWNFCPWSTQPQSLSWEYPASTAEVDEFEYWPITTVEIELLEKGRRGSHIGVADLYLSGDPSEPRLQLSRADFMKHLAVIEAHRAGDRDPLPVFRVI